MSHPSMPGPYGPPPGPYGGPPYPPWAQQPDPRPATVTAAGVITIVVAGIGALGVIAGGVLVALFGFLVGAMAESKSPGDPEADQFTAVILLAAIGFVVVGVAFFVLLAVLGVRVLHRGRVARVVLAVLDVLGLALSLAAVAALALNGTTDWIVVLVVQAVPSAAVLVLLFTGGANEWFARRPPPPR